MRKYRKAVKEAEEEYLPEGPPMSPLTRSFFINWAFYDLRFDGMDTLGSCFLDCQESLEIPKDLLGPLKAMVSSRMGVYEHRGFDGPKIVLRELIIGTETSCLTLTSYRGQPGELWYVRMLPPPLPERTSCSIILTTPYILLASKEDWLAFLKRGLTDNRLEINPGGLQHFLKFGPKPLYWPEYVFVAYSRSQGQAIFLAGIPDRKST